MKLYFVQATFTKTVTLHSVAHKKHEYLCHAIFKKLKKLDMDNTMLIQITNRKAVRLLHELEELHLIKVLKENIKPLETKLSDKYKGVFSKEDAASFDEHTQTMRNE